MLSTTTFMFHEVPKIKIEQNKDKSEIKKTNIIKQKQNKNTNEYQQHIQVYDICTFKINNL